ncbi:MAG: hypothetical protein D6677_12180 [Calditrichaeota bacterium]|nr:MAG: hypothetical protein D6677_12180 [Calditrichota bacterium]
MPFFILDKNTAFSAAMRKNDTHLRKNDKHPPEPFGNVNQAIHKKRPHGLVNKYEYYGRTTKT